MNSKKKSVATQGDAAYKEDLFLLWYKKGKLGVKPFYNIIPASGLVESLLALELARRGINRFYVLRRKSRK